VASGKIFGDGFDVQTPYFGSITAIHLCYLGKGWEVALQLSTSFLEIAKAKWQLPMGNDRVVFHPAIHGNTSSY
jgi:hypothetical protein